MRSIVATTEDLRDAAKFAFLDALRAKYTVRHAARAAGVGRRTVYDWRNDDPEFAAAWADAREDAIDALEETMYEKALNGETLAGFFMLKGMRPETYRDNVRVTHSGFIGEARVDLSQLSADDRIALIELALERARLSQTIVVG